MGYNKDDRFKEEGTGNGRPQYGKKGFKPRRNVQRPETNLDEIVTNNIAYWNKTSGFSNVSKFAWNMIVGKPVDKSEFLSNMLDSSTAAFNRYLPGQVMQLDLIIGPGYADTVASPVNRALMQFMARIRAALSTSNLGLETADLGIYFASTSNIAAHIGQAKKVLEAYQVWRDRNMNYPRTLIEASGFKYEDIRDNINEYAMRLNAMIDMYNNISILDIWDVFDRQYVLFHNIYCDEDTEFGQLYIFRPVNFYKYTDTAVPSKATAVTVPWDTYTTFGDYLTDIQKLIDAWYNSSDLYQINGCLLRAFKEAPKQMIPYYTVGDRISPVIDREHLMQIMNCSIIDAKPADITQDPNTQNYVIWTPYIHAGNLDSGDKPANLYAADKVMLRIYEEDVTEEDNMEMTRLTNFMPLYSATQGNYPKLVGCGSEIVTKVRIYAYDTKSASVRTLAAFTDNVYTIVQSNDALTATLPYIRAISALATFRYAPTIHLAIAMYDGSPSSVFTNVYYGGGCTDAYNYMLYNRKDWENLQFVAYNSLWTPKNL